MKFLDRIKAFFKPASPKDIQIQPTIASPKPDHNEVNLDLKLTELFVKLNSLGVDPSKPLLPDFTPVMFDPKLSALIAEAFANKGCYMIITPQEKMLNLQKSCLSSEPTFNMPWHDNQEAFRASSLNS